jgi:hypothetical protein
MLEYILFAFYLISMQQDFFFKFKFLENGFMVKMSLIAVMNQSLKCLDKNKYLDNCLFEGM